MPLVTVELFEELFRNVFDDAESGPSTVDCVVPELVAHGPSEGSKPGGLRLDPLCAVYHRRCATAARRAIDRKILKMHDFVSTLRLRRHPVTDPALLSNVNTPPEWSSL
jgi:molybdopterin-guanine dinucleotide biosynthesis protein A